MNAIYIRLAEDEVDNPIQWTSTYSGGDHTGDSSNKLDVEMVPDGEEMTGLLVTNNDSVFHQVQIFYGDKHWINANLDPNDELLYLIPPDGTGWTFPSEPVTNIRNLEILIDNPTNGQVLTYENGVWVNADPTGGGGGGDLPSFTGHAGEFLQVNNAETAGQWHALVKGDVGLGNVNNTSDASKPISTATQTALNLKANIASPTFTGTVSGIDKTMVGLGNVDNTSDLGKPISTATQTALDLKQDTLVNQVNIKSVNGNSLLGSGDLVLSTVAALDDLTDVVITSVSSGQFLKYNGTNWVNANPTKSDVGLGNVDNTSDANKPVSTATQTALDLKADLASPTFTGTVSGITKSMVGLSNVDNTSDANKPVSTATQTALNLKLDITTATSTYQPLDGDLTAIAALSTNGFAKRTGTNTWAIDTNTYLTGNQTITLSGDATGSGTTAITLTLANSGVTASTYKSVTVDAKGRVTAGTNPTTLSGFGITAPLDDLSDVVITSPTTGQVVAYNGTNWVNSAPSGSADPKDILPLHFMFLGF